MLYLRLDAWPRPSLVKSQFGNIKTRNPDRSEFVRLLDIGSMESGDSHPTIRIRIYVVPAWFEFDEIRSDNRHSGISCCSAALLNICKLSRIFILCTNEIVEATLNLYTSNYRKKKNHFLGIKMMYYHYSSSKREEINRLRTQLFGDDYQLGNNRNEQM